MKKRLLTNIEKGLKKKGNKILLDDKTKKGEKCRIIVGVVGEEGNELKYDATISIKGHNDHYIINTNKEDLINKITEKLGNTN